MMENNPKQSRPALQGHTEYKISEHVGNVLKQGHTVNEQ